MLSFENDYSEGAHEKILQRFMETNLEKVSGYGSDPYCESAKQKIREACECPQADVYFLTGGTQTNAVVISSMLESYEGVVAAQTGHVACHEAGAIEYSGHKVITVPQYKGKMKAEDLKNCLKTFWETKATNIWYFRGWFIFPILRSTVLCIQRGSWKRSAAYAAVIISHCFSTEQDWAMV